MGRDFDVGIEVAAEEDLLRGLVGPAGVEVPDNLAGFGFAARGGEEEVHRVASCGFKVGRIDMKWIGAREVDLNVEKFTSEFIGEITDYVTGISPGVDDGVAEITNGIAAEDGLAIEGVVIARTHDVIVSEVSIAEAHEIADGRECVGHLLESIHVGIQETGDTAGGVEGGSASIIERFPRVPRDDRDVGRSAKLRRGSQDNERCVPSARV